MLNRRLNKKSAYNNTCVYAIAFMIYAFVNLFRCEFICMAIWLSVWVCVCSVALHKWTTRVIEMQPSASIFARYTFMRIFFYQLLSFVFFLWPLRLSLIASWLWLSTLEIKVLLANKNKIDFVGEGHLCASCALKWIFRIYIRI